MNAYVRSLAREAGRLKARASSCGGIRYHKEGGEQPKWLIDDPEGFVERIWDLEERAYRWRYAPWCSVQAGRAVEGGALSAGAVVWSLGNVLALPVVLALVGAVVYGLMALGASVLE